MVSEHTNPGSFARWCLWMISAVLVVPFLPLLILICRVPFYHDGRKYRWDK
jgi:hypothetical protein